MTSKLLRYLLAPAVVSLPSAAAAQAPTSPANTSVEQVVDRVGQNEAALKAKMRELHPIIEVYIQGVVADVKLGPVPSGDEYFLGRFDWDQKDGPKLHALTPSKASAASWFT